MKITFSYHNPRAVKARFARFFTKRSVFVLRLLAAVLVASGLLLVAAQPRLAALSAAAALFLIMLLIWHFGDLSILEPKMPSEEQMDLALSLDKNMLSRLRQQPTTLEIFEIAKKHWHWHFFGSRYGLAGAFFQSQEVQLVEPDHLWEDAWQLSKKYGYSGVVPGAVVVALFLRLASSQEVLNLLKIEQRELEDGLSWLKHLEETYQAAKSKQNYGGIGRDWASGYTPTLNRIAHNISADIQYGGFWTRETQSHNNMINQVIKVLSKSKTSSVALVGETGVGKTTAVYALAKKLLTEKVPGLRYHQVFVLDASTMIANTNTRQSLERLLLRTFGEAATAGNVIIFLDEAQAFMSHGTGSLDMTNVLLQVLQSGRVRLILAMSPKDWQIITSKTATLAGLLNYQTMAAANEEETIQIMQDQLITIEHKNNVIFTYQAVKEAYRLAGKYMHDIAFPGKGIQLLEETAVFAGKGLVTTETVGKSIESKLGVKAVQPGADEGQKLLSLEDDLHKRLINQKRAVEVVANALRRSRSGVGNPNRPVGAFLFLGPTGVGKTELAKALAEVYFSGSEQIIRINLNEYSQPKDVSRLLAAVGDSGGSNSFLAQIRRQPYSVVLMDEIEKAHPEVLNVLLQLLDEGILKDESGKEASLRDSIIIATSNAGAEEIRKQIDAGRDLEEFEEEFTNQLIDQNLFRPEFLNRFDEIVLFRPLTPEELQLVVQLMIGEVNQTLQRQKVKVSLTENAVKWLVEQGNDPRLGARPMRRMVQRSVENIVAKKLLEGSAGPGSEIMLDVTDLENSKK